MADEKAYPLTPSGMKTIRLAAPADAARGDIERIGDVLGFYLEDVKAGDMTEFCFSCDLVRCHTPRRGGDDASYIDGVTVAGDYLIRERSVDDGPWRLVPLKDARDKRAGTQGRLLVGQAVGYAATNAKNGTGIDIVWVRQ